MAKKIIKKKERAVRKKGGRGEESNPPETQRANLHPDYTQQHLIPREKYNTLLTNDHKSGGPLSVESLAKAFQLPNFPRKWFMCRLVGTCPHLFSVFLPPDAVATVTVLPPPPTAGTRRRILRVGKERKGGVPGEGGGWKTGCVSLLPLPNLVEGWNNFKDALFWNTGNAGASVEKSAMLCYFNGKLGTLNRDYLWTRISIETL